MTSSWDAIQQTQVLRPLFLQLTATTASNEEETEESLQNQQSKGEPSPAIYTEVFHSDFLLHHARYMGQVLIS